VSGGTPVALAGRQCTGGTPGHYERSEKSREPRVRGDRDTTREPRATREPRVYEGTESTSRARYYEGTEILRGNRELRGN